MKYDSSIIKLILLFCKIKIFFASVPIAFSIIGKVYPQQVTATTLCSGYEVYTVVAHAHNLEYLRIWKPYNLLIYARSMQLYLAWK